MGKPSAGWVNAHTHAYTRIHTHTHAYNKLQGRRGHVHVARALGATRSSHTSGRNGPAAHSSAELGHGKWGKGAASDPAREGVVCRQRRPQDLPAKQRRAREGASCGGVESMLKLVRPQQRLAQVCHPRHGLPAPFFYVPMHRGWHRGQLSSRPCHRYVVVAVARWSHKSPIVRYGNESEEDGGRRSGGCVCSGALAWRGEARDRGVRRVSRQYQGGGGVPGALGCAASSLRRAVFALIKTPRA